MRSTPDYFVAPEPKTVRTLNEVIDLAILENRGSERLMYVIAATVVVVGAFVLIWRVVTRGWIAMGQIRLRKIATRRSSTAPREDVDTMSHRRLQLQVFHSNRDATLVRDESV